MATRVVKFRLRGPFLKIFKTDATEILLAGPSGTGKSTAALIYVHAMCIKHTGLRVLLARKTAESLTDSTINTFKTHVAQDWIDMGAVAFFGGNAQTARGFQYANGSVIVTQGLDKVDRIRSAEYDLIVVDEATELQEYDWQVLTTRLRGAVDMLPRRQIIGACNPDRPDHWIKRRCESGTITMLETRHEDNPAYYDEAGDLTTSGKDYIAQLDKLTGLNHKRYRLGLWVAADGIVYDQFDPAQHVVAPFKIPDEWTRYWVVDFGYAHPFLCQWWAEDPDGKLWMYREWYKTGWTVEDHAAKMMSFVTDEEGNWTEPKPQALIVDHQAENVAQLRKGTGLSPMLAHKSVIEGIEAVQVRLKTNRIAYLFDAPVIRDPAQVDARKPASTVEEFAGYIWDQGKGKTGKEAPVKANDEGMDCTRYMVAYKDLTGHSRVGWV